jgi:hypothetical protein
MYRPPVDMPMNGTAQIWATIVTGGLATLMFAGALWEMRRTRSPFLLFLLIGGAISIVNEPFTNVLGNVYHYSIGQWNLFTTFDRPMPIWVVFAYVIFFGGITAMYEKLMEYGVSRARLWSAFVTVLAANLTFDLTAIHGGLYVYYGFQPMSIWGSPVLWWVFVNGTGPVIAATLMSRWRDWFEGRKLLLAALLPAATQAACTGMIGLPVFSLLQGGPDVSHAAQYCAAIVTIIVGAFVVDFFFRLSVHGRAVAAGLPDRAVAQPASA